MLRCGGCGITCPGFTAAGFESNTPRGRMRIAKGVLEGKLELTDALVERVFLCNQCGYCKLRCTFSPVDVIYALKAEIVKAGKAPQEIYAMAKSVQFHNMCFKPHANRLDCLPEEMRTPRKADVLFFLSCYPAYEVPSSVQATTKILNEAGVKWTTLGKDEWCCGLPMLEYGLPEKFREHFEHNVNAINKASENLGVTQMIASCPGCATAFKIYPKRFGLTLNVEVLHTTEFFNQLIKEGKIRFKEWKTKCTYHDACFLGRWQGIYQEPRECLKAIPGVQLVEIEPNKDFSSCCGSIPWWDVHPGYGVHLDVKHIRLTHKITLKRIKQIEETGADTVVVSCHGCLTLGLMLRGKHSKIDAKLISEALAQNLISKDD